MPCKKCLSGWVVVIPLKGKRARSERPELVRLTTTYTAGRFPSSVRQLTSSPMRLRAARLTKRNGMTLLSLPIAKRKPCAIVRLDQPAQSSRIGDAGNAGPVLLPRVKGVLGSDEPSTSEHVIQIPDEPQLINLARHLRPGLIVT